MPVPAGETGGGVLHAIVGTLLIVGVASLIGLPLGIGGGHLLRRVSRLPARHRHPVRGRRAQRHPVDRGRRLRLDLDRVAAEALLRPGRQRRAGHPDDPDGDADHRGDDQAGAALAAGGGPGARATPRWRTCLTVVVRTTLPGIVTGSLLAVARIAGETAPLLFTALGSQYLSFNLDQPMAALPLVVFNYAIGPLRGVAPAGLGHRAGPDPRGAGPQHRGAAGHAPEILAEWLTPTPRIATER